MPRKPEKHIVEYRFLRSNLYLWLPMLLAAAIFVGSIFYINQVHKDWRTRYEKNIPIMKAGKDVCYFRIEEAYERQFNDLLVILCSAVVIIAIVIPLINHSINRCDIERCNIKLEALAGRLELQLGNKEAEIEERLAKIEHELEKKLKSSKKAK
ncbi:MAG: hypothetical protein GY750_08175 [Lentisphaerae bacterium]|nr:hypothetical protein [Lentisphaerota bacterium]MCP4101385.1 hypothetical protein [Lentisphaerota bacterium]